MHKKTSLIEYFFQSWLKITPKMIVNDVLIIDRFYIDFLVDQSLNYNETKETTLSRKSRLKKIFPPVDVNLIFIIKEDTAIARGKENDIVYIKDLKQAFNTFINEPDCVFIDANKSEKEVFTNVISILNTRVLNG